MSEAGLQLALNWDTALRVSRFHPTRRAAGADARALQRLASHVRAHRRQLLPEAPYMCGEPGALHGACVGKFDHTIEEEMVPARLPTATRMRSLMVRNKSSRRSTTGQDHRGGRRSHAGLSGCNASPPLSAEHPRPEGVNGLPPCPQARLVLGRMD